MAVMAAHAFDVHTYTSPVHCDHCDAFIWGLVKQGFRCVDCGYNVHRQCVNHVATACDHDGAVGRALAGFHAGLLTPPASSRASSPSPRGSPRSWEVPGGPMVSEDGALMPPTGGQLRQRRGTASSGSRRPSHDRRSRSPSDVGSIATTVSRSRAGKRRSHSQGPPSLAPSSPGFVNTLLQTTAQRAAELAEGHKEIPLGVLTTTPKNTALFIARIGPVRRTQHAIISVLTWEVPSRTLTALVAYITLCLYPALLCVLPQMVMISLIVHNYYNRTKSRYVKKSPSSLYKHDAKKYAQNLHFLQNSMGDYAALYLKVRKDAEVLAWSDEARTLQLLKLCVGSMFGTLLVLRWVPFNYIALSGGLVLFFQNTAFYQALCATVPSAVAATMRSTLDDVRDALARAHAAAQAGGSNAGQATDIVVSLYENQRWWAGLGWLPHLLRSERPAWSDATGGAARPAKDDFVLPTQGGAWSWVEPQWRVDVGWAEVDEAGWQYTDHAWAAPRPQPAISSLTRRRLWVRTLRCRPTPDAARGGSPPALSLMR